MALGKYQDIEPDFNKTPNGGGIGAKRFSKILEKRCRCKLAWHKKRRVFIVYRMQGSKVVSYMDLRPDKHFPLSPSLIPMICSTVKVVDAHSSGDYEKSLREYMARQKKEKDDGIKKYVDDRFPEFKAYAAWSWNKMNDRTSRPVVV